MLEQMHYLVIDGVPSSDFGVYVTNAGVFDVPEKDYEMRSINGRSGSLYISYDRWENVEVEYPAIVLGNFQTNFDEFISFLMSKDGYFRLEDTIRPDIYREGLFLGKVSAKVTPEGKQGTFEITFSCKPQKWLVSGEKPIEAPDAGIWYITNNTRFPARPLVEVYGYGTLWMNGYSLEVKNRTIGNIKLIDFIRQSDEAPSVPLSITGYYDSSDFNEGDKARLDAKWWVRFAMEDARVGTITLQERSVSDNCTTTREINSEGQITIGTVLTGDAYDMSDSETTITKTTVVRVSYDNLEGYPTYEDVNIIVEITVDSGSLTISEISFGDTVGVQWIKETKQIDSFVVNSTVSSLGNPLYVDMETGDAYKYDDEDKIVYVNHAIWIGEKLPVLESGKTMIVPDSNMTVRIVPRWWTI